MARSRPQPRNQIKPLGMTRINLAYQVKKLGADSLLPPELPLRRKRTARPDFGPYCIRKGKDGKTGIYLRSFNVRLATFNANTKGLQIALEILFDQDYPHQPKPKKRKRKEPVRNEAWGPGSGNW